MAVGDVVSGVGLASTSLIFQPAATIEVAVTQVCAATIRLYDGATTWDTGSIWSNTKILINNSIYLFLESTSATRVAFTGIQIK